MIKVLISLILKGQKVDSTFMLWEGNYINNWASTKMKNELYFVKVISATFEKLDMYLHCATPEKVKRFVQGNVCSIH